MNIRVTSLLSCATATAIVAILGSNGGCSSGDALIGTESSDGAVSSSTTTSSSAGSTSGTSSSVTSSSSASGGVDAGSCCPAGWGLHNCTFADGGAGFACHNPALGCVSSNTCGE